MADSKGDATDVNEQTKSGMTPLMCAVKVLGPKNGDDGIVAFLLENKANVNLQDVMGDTVLHIACCSKVIAVCSSLSLSLSPFLLFFLSVSVSVSVSLALSLSLCVPACPGVLFLSFSLTVSSFCSYLPCYQLWRKSKISYAFQDPLNPLLPKGFEKLTQALIDGNADVNICNKIGQTALHRASLVHMHPHTY